MAQKPKSRYRFSKDVQNDLVTITKLGGTKTIAAQYAGISLYTLERWLERGRDGETPFVGLVKEMEQARGECAASCLHKINAAAKNNWTAAAWLLERMFPEEYGKQSVDVRLILARLSNQDLLTQSTAIGISKDDVI